MKAAPVALAALAVSTAGCGAWFERPFAGLRGPDDGEGNGTFVRRYEAPVPCGAGPYPSVYTGGRRDVLDIGPLRFQGLANQLDAERFRPGSPALTVPVDVPARARVVISVPAETLDVAALDTDPRPVDRPAEGHRAVSCSTGEFSQVHSLSFVVAGPRCVPVSVTMRGVTTTRNVPFGVRRCG